MGDEFNLRHMIVPSTKGYGMDREAGPRLRPAVELLSAREQFAPWLANYLELRGLNGLLAFDLQTSMADQLLMKVDKTTMRTSRPAWIAKLFSTPSNELAMFSSASSRFT